MRKHVLAAGLVAGAIALAGPGAVATSAAAPVRGASAVRQAEPPPGVPAPGPARGRRQAAGPRPDPAKLATAQDALDGIEIATADKFLEVPSERYGDFIQRLRELQLVRRRRQIARLQLLNAIRRQVNQQPTDDARLDATIGQFDDFDRQTVEDVRAAYGKIDEILTLRQRARFRIFEEQMEQRKLEILTRVLRK